MADLTRLEVAKRLTGMADILASDPEPTMRAFADDLVAAALYLRADPPVAAEVREAPNNLDPEDVEWVVNDIAELGVKIGNQFFFLYKGRSLVYDSAAQDGEAPKHWRPVFKREFGECCHPINYNDPTLIGTVSLDDSDEWQPLPAAEGGGSR